MCRKPRFTPIELFIVVTLLSALLLPALQRARESAHQHNCVSNLKQIGIALIMYSAANKDHLPAGPALAGDDKSIVDAADFYGASGRAGGFELLRVNCYLNDYVVYVCPSTSVRAGSGQDSLSWTNAGSGSGRANLSYAYHAGMVMGDSIDTGRPGSGVSADLTGDAGIDSNDGQPNHTKSGNILFLDGHVGGFHGLGWFSPERAGYPTYGSAERGAAMIPNTLRDPVTGEVL